MQFSINGNSITINANTKEELETIRKELQYALDHVNGQLRTAARADHLHFDDATDEGRRPLDRLTNSAIGPH